MLIRRGFIVFLAAIIPSTLTAKTDHIVGNKFPVRNQYLIQLAAEKATPEVAVDLIGPLGGRVLDRSDFGPIQVIVAEINENAAEALTNNPRVEQVEEVGEIFPSTEGTALPWHLDRIDQRGPSVDPSAPYERLPLNPNQNVRVYVLDTGIWRSHSEFSLFSPSVVAAGINTTDDGTGDAFVTFRGQDNLWRSADNPSYYNDASGGHPGWFVNEYTSHGTAVASLIGGYNLGVAPGVTLVPVKILNSLGRGSSSQEIDGLEWLAQDLIANGTPAVINISGFSSPATNDVSIIEKELSSLIAGCKSGSTVVPGSNGWINTLCAAPPSMTFTITGSLPSGRVLHGATVNFINRSATSHTLHSSAFSHDIYLPAGTSASAEVTANLDGADTTVTYTCLEPGHQNEVGSITVAEKFPTVVLVTSSNNFNDTPGNTACDLSPSRLPRAITVGGTMRVSNITGTQVPDAVWRCNSEDEKDAQGNPVECVFELYGGQMSGTVSATANDTYLAGSGTRFRQDLRTGQEIKVSTYLNEVTQILTDASARVKNPWPVQLTDRNLSVNRTADGSNTGPCVDIFAPAHRIKAADLASTNVKWQDVDANNVRAPLNPNAHREHGTDSGTSFAAPIVAGLAAYYLSWHPTASPATVQDWLVANATANVVDLTSTNTVTLSGTTRALAFSKFGVIHHLNPHIASAATAGTPMTLQVWGGNLPPKLVAGNPNLQVTMGTAAANVVSSDGMTAQFDKPTWLSDAGALYSITLTGSVYGYRGGTGQWITSTETKLPRGFMVEFNDTYDPNTQKTWYDFVEKLLRYRITSGCTAGNFCKDDSILRQQMAVFTGLARHGASHLPAACTTLSWYSTPGGVSVTPAGDNESFTIQRTSPRTGAWDTVAKSLTGINAGVLQFSPTTVGAEMKVGFGTTDPPPLNSGHTAYFEFYVSNNVAFVRIAGTNVPGVNWNATYTTASVFQIQKLLDGRHRFFVNDALVYEQPTGTAHVEYVKAMFLSQYASVNGLRVRRFNDVPSVSGYCKWIAELADDQIVSGCDQYSLRYCPANAVTRAQMSVFLLLPKWYPTWPAGDSTGNPFGDVSGSFAPWITRLYEQGITGGCGMNLYCPSTPVTRGQMAVFLGAAFDFQCGIAAACTAQPNPAAAEPPLPYDPVPEQ